MKQRNAMIAVWAALLLSVGTALVLAVQDGGPSAGNDIFFIPESELKPGQRERIVVNPEAAEVRLFVEGIPFREPSRTRELIDDVDGVLLTKAQRDILERSLHRYRLPPSEFEDYPACFIPHHFFRYYDAQGNELGELAVCYCCRQVRLNSWSYRRIEGEILQFDYEAIEKMLAGMKVPTNINC